MNDFWCGFIVGVIGGAFFSVIVVGLINAASKASEQERRFYNALNETDEKARRVRNGY